MASSFKKDRLIIGQRLKKLREDRGLSLRAWAGELGIEHRQLVRLEEGEADFRISSLLHILKSCEMTMQEFFQDLDIPRSSN